MNKNQSDENIILKQRLIHYQSEINKYKDQLKRYEKVGNLNQFSQLQYERERLVIQVNELNQEVKALKQQVEKLQSENNILKGNRINVQEVKYDQDGKKQVLDSWFVKNLENQNAIKRTNRLLSDKRNSDDQ